ncbi:response regulator [Ramlibacter sp. AW1]|uniref:Sensory/regulatory protein RpfC n=1 Tax=Ramlibacter aurantiacus TaxID=2801330 RepID=A0A936ZMR6_9BURK|nr:ATP-binding protein [Ramlibacter aurantiacus]MBL0420541.1 response regulator [Ramlibacter aurantiacus]
MPTSLNRRQLFPATVAIGAALLVALVAALWTTIERAREASRQVVHTYAVIDAVDLLEASAVRLEAGQRGLLVAGHLRFVQEREQAIEALRAGVAELQHLSRADPDRQARLALLAARIADRVQMARRNEHAVREGLFDRQAAVESAEAGQAAGAVATAISELRSHERRQLERQRARELDLQRRSAVLLAGAFLGGGLLVVLIVWGWRRQALRNAAIELRMHDLVQALPVSLWQLRERPGGRMAFEFISDNARSIRHIDVDAVRRDQAQVMANIHPPDRPVVEQALRQSSQTLSPLDLQYRVDAGAQGLRWIHSGATLRRQPDGSLLWSGYWADITAELDLKQALESATQAATQANAAKSAFLAAMSHEIRTPMNGVLGLLELLSLSRLDDEQRSTLAVVRESGRSLLRIVDDILDFSKIEANKLSLHPEPSSVAQVVQSICQIHSSMASSKGLLLQAHTDPRISPALMFDPQRLGQILNNLVSNALKFTQRGSVSVNVQWLGHSERGERLCLVVRDTGMGVPREDIARLFQPYVQSQQAAARFGGTGLGLVISRRLAEMMGGSLEMDSEPGHGTTVTLRCELMVAADPTDPRRPPAQEPASGHHPPRRPTPSRQQAEHEGRLILVVDDHPTNRIVLRRQVNSLGYAAEVAADGRQALDAWRTGRFGLVLADCNMPEMSGYELTQAIRQDEAARGLPRTPVLACTANAMASQAAACEEAGMDAWLVKPCGLHQLSEQLGRWLPHPADEPGHPEDEAAIDIALLDSLVGDDAPARAEILADFRRATEADATSLRTAVADADLGTVRATAHRIQGASLSLGAAALARSCGALEQAARDADSTALAALMSTFEREFARVCAQLDVLRVATL